MKTTLLFLLFVLGLPISSNGQSIFRNSIVGANPNSSNPYVLGQIIDPNITVSGIGRGSTIFGVNANDRYDAKSWKTDALDSNAYFEFTITPNVGKEIDFVSFEFTGQISVNGPTLFSFRSSRDNFTSDIGIITGNGAVVSLSSIAFQNVTSATTFRIYAWAAVMGTGTFSINDFQFNGVVSCSNPSAVVLAEPITKCFGSSYTVQWSSSAMTDNYFIDVATDSGFSHYLPGYQNKSLGNSLTETITSLEVGTTYFVRLRSENDCGISIISNVIELLSPITTFNGSWSNGLPDANKNVLFASDYTISSSFEACSCEIAENVNVQVLSGLVFKIEQGLNLSNTSTLTFENNASLVQINNNAVNTGNIIYKRTTSAIKDFDYVYWSSPVKDQILNTLSPLTDKYWSWASGAWAAEARTNNMNPAGKGFIIRVPRYVTSQTVSFEGVPNNGVVTIPSQGVDQNNLIGNPYPSAIDADAFINANNTIISGALYFWTHNTARAINVGGTAMIYTSDDYATYTLTGGTGTSAAKSTDTNGDGIGDGVVPLGDIAAGQSFFVGSTGVGNFVFNNGMRISDPGKNSQFFKQTATKKEAKIEKSRIWLNLTNAEGAFKQLLVGYITGATNDKDRLYDGVSNNANKFIDFYSQDNSQKYTIQGRALPFVPTDEVPLGYKSTIDGTFKIYIENTDGVLTNQEIYLEDKLTGNYHDLKNGAYSFSTAQGEFKDRFVLRYTGKTLGIDDTENPTKGKGVVVSVKKHQIKVNSFDETLKSIKVYDLKGSLVYNKEKLSGNEFVISQLTSSDQFVIVMIQLESGNWSNEEIFYE